MTDGARKVSLEMLHPRSLGYLSEQLQSLVRGRLWLQVLVGMVLGIAVGRMARAPDRCRVISVEVGTSD